MQPRMSIPRRSDRSEPQGTKFTEAPKGAPANASRGLIFASVVGICVMLAGAYVTSAALRNDDRRDSPFDAAIEEARTVPQAAMVTDENGSVLFQNLIAGDHWLQVGSVDVGVPDWPRTMLPLECERVHYAADRGLCLAETALGHYVAF